MVLQEVLKWSADRPAWQRDALRRLVLAGDLNGEDLEALTEICKSAHGLADVAGFAPLASEHIPSGQGANCRVRLASIFHQRGVNALAESQTLKFSPGLTVVYGDNGAGKTGYIRILKSACRARGQEQILGNVVSGASPLKPAVTIKYIVGDEDEPREWNGGLDDPFVSRVSVFDTQSASIYLTEKTDVAFRPFGLDLFDRLAKACKAVRANLTKEQALLSQSTLLSLQELLSKETAAAKFLSGISSLTKPDNVNEIVGLSSEEEEKLALLEKSLLDLQANDPKKLRVQLKLRSDRFRALKMHLEAVEAALSSDKVSAVISVRAEGRRKRIEATRLREATFPNDLLSGTGNDTWKTLWEAARLFSHDHAYPDQEFPVIRDAKCVLCQQELQAGAVGRFEQFKAFVSSTTELELAELRRAFSEARRNFADLEVSTASVAETLKELQVEHEVVAREVSVAIEKNQSRKRSIVDSLTEDKDIDVNLSAAVVTSGRLTALIAQLDERIKALEDESIDDKRKGMNADAEELRARRTLGGYKDAILADIERRGKYAAYGLCIDDTKSTAITLKGGEITKRIVSKKLKSSFQDEIDRLGFRHVEVELKESGGADGVFYHKLILTRAPGVDLPKIVSEGEQRCLSIAAFFAELSTADGASGIVFDDPVSSLDFQWRHSVARRLVLESRHRQVVVFTHDVVFLLLLRQYAEELDVAAFDQHVRHSSSGAGVCADELPWVALPVRRKIGYLKSKWQQADKLSREGHGDAYEKEAQYLYGLLREAWERALEEVLLGGVVERYRPGIQTQQLALLADITPDDCKAVDIAMTKCSAWLPGHDQAAAARAPVPGSSDLKADIEALESWVGSVRKRRDKKPAVAS